MYDVTGILAWTASGCISFFNGKEQIKVLWNKHVDELLREESIRVCDAHISHMGCG